MPESWRFVVEAGAHDRVLCPVVIKLPQIQGMAAAVELRDAKTRKKIPCQLLHDGEDALLMWIVPALQSGRKQTVEARWIEPILGVPVMVVRDDARRGVVTISEQGEAFTAYHYGKKWVRPFFHPFIGPWGVSVTRHWPVKKTVKGEPRDHSHHKSLWVAYGNCSGVDHWSEEPGHGWQRHQRFLALDSGPVMGRLTALTYWRRPDGGKQFEEVREACFYRMTRGERLMDLRVTLRMTEGPVRFQGTKEGGLVSARVAPGLAVNGGGRIENGFGGVNEEETWGKAAPWCDYSGKIQGRRVGLAICDHPANPRYPTGWHVRDYGLMTANGFAWKQYAPDTAELGDMVFRQGQETTWRYRLYVHRGNARTGDVAGRYLDFAFPPRVRMA